MNEIEKKLANYRAERDREGRYTTFIAKFKEHKENLVETDETEIHVIQTTNDNLSVNSLEEDDTVKFNCTYVNWIYYSLYFILWATLYSIFIKLEFGTVYLIVTGLIGIYFNTRTGPKMVGEISAYSVFNTDCKSIDGTLKAEQFEREIRYGPAVIR